MESQRLALKAKQMKMEEPPSLPRLTPTFREAESAISSMMAFERKRKEREADMREL